MSYNIDWTTSAITAKQKTLWSGTIADTTTSAPLSEPVKSGYLYTITFASLSSSYLCTYTFYGGSTEHQFYQSDGTYYVRWRIVFSNDYNTARLSAITTNVQNISLVALKDISRVVVGDFS